METHSVKKTVWCTWAQEACIGSACKFGFCVKRAMLPDGKCRFKMKSKQKTFDLEKEVLKERENLMIPSDERRKWRDYI